MSILKRKKKTSSSVPSESSTPPTEERVNESEHHEPPLPTLEVLAEVADLNLSEFFMEYHMTVISSDSSLSQKNASILLMTCVYLALSEGVDVTLYLVMEWLFNFMLKSKSPLEYPFEKGKQTLLLAELILSCIRGTFLSLQEREQLPDEIRVALIRSGWIPDERQLKSWASTYSVRRYFRIRTVRMDAFMNPERNSERYSGYTKGYGEGGSLARKQKTPFSAELDGDDTEKPKYEFSLLEISKYNDILTTIEKWKSIKRE